MITCRENTQRLQDYPWRTAFIYDLPDFCNINLQGPDIAITSFLNNLSRFEHMLFSEPVYSASEVGDLREAIAYLPKQLNSGEPRPWPQTKNFKRYGHLCTVLTCYRMAEVFLRSVNRTRPSHKIIQRGELSGHKTVISKVWRRMEDLDTLIRDFTLLFLPSLNPPSQKPSTGDTSVLKTLPYHLQNLARFSGKIKADSVALNFSWAAAHAYYLASQDFGGCLPDLPASFQDFLQVIARPTSHPLGLSLVEMNFLKDLGTHTDISNARTPLEVALHITPLALLLPLDLSKAPVSRVFILEAAMALGNQTLAEVEVLESLTMKALLDIINGHDAVGTVLNRLSDDFSNLLISSPPQDPRFKTWFMLQHPQPHSSDITMPLVSLGTANLGQSLCLINDPDATPMEDDLGSTTKIHHGHNLGAISQPGNRMDTNHGPPRITCRIEDEHTQQDGFREGSGSRDVQIQPSTNDADGSDEERDSTEIDILIRHRKDTSTEARKDKRFTGQEAMQVDSLGPGPSAKRDLPFELRHIPSRFKNTDLDQIRSRDSLSPPPKRRNLGPADKKLPPKKRPSPTLKLNTEIPPEAKQKGAKTPVPRGVLLTTSSSLSAKVINQPNAFFLNDESEDNSIDVLNIQETAERFEATREYLLYGPASSDPSPYRPVGHFKTELANQEALIQAVESFYQDGLPHHISKPEESCFRIISRMEFDSLLPRQVQLILQHQCIFIPDYTSQTYNFDEEGLRSLAPLTRITTIQDLSKKPRMNGHNDRRRNGTPKDMIAASRKPGGKILNGLYFPGELLTDHDAPFSSELFAWRLTASRKDCSQDGELPVSALRWGLAATSGARHGWHIDSNGLGTYIDFFAKKFWCIASGTDLSNTAVILGKDFNIDRPTPSLGKIEGILCLPGSRLVMPPRVLHSVITVDHAICHGGHFYSFHLMHRTLCAMIHVLVAGNYITNNDHAPANILLRRMLAFCHETLVRGKLLEEPHVFDHSLVLSEFQGFMNFLALINIHMMGDILDVLAYRTPYPFTSDESRYTMHFRGMALNMLKWFARHYKITDPRTHQELDSLHDVALPHLARQGRALVKYKQRSIRAKLTSEVKFSHVAVEERLWAIFRVHDMTRRAWIQSSADVTDSLDWPCDRPLKIERRALPLERDELKAFANFVQAGAPFPLNEDCAV